jgi:peptidoglycan hydrolase-like protein with peptidoglycan-binding domain
MAYPNLQQGSKGEYVKIVQKHLGITVDGSYGPATVKAVKQFQARKGLATDGKVGPATWKALIATYASGPSPTGSVGSPSTSGSGSSGIAMNTVVNGPLNMVIGGVLLYGLFKVFMRIF